MTAQPTPAPGGVAPYIGRVIGGKYRVTAPLGEGGMGVVVAADDMTTGQRVALKILRPEMLEDQDVTRRFLEEGATASRIQHPNVLRVLGSGTTELGTPFIVMEHLDGTSLGTFMRGSRIPPAAAVPILQGILAGLGAAHAAGVVHRDLKPENVFLERKASGTSGYEVKLLDFGVARVMDAAGGMGSRTKTGILLGTPAYMSPEQLRNSKDADGRTDLWAAGVMLYEMLCGRHPFPAPTEFARLAVILNSPPEPIDDVARPFAAVLDRALAKDRDARFSSAHEMAAALSQAPTSAVRPATEPMASLPSPTQQHLNVPAAFTPTALQPAVAAEVIQRISALPESTPGGTLNSPANRSPSTTLSSGGAGGGVGRHSAPPPVVMIPPSEPEAPAARGLAVPIVVAFVGVALVLGFLLGFAVGRLQ